MATPELFPTTFWTFWWQHCELIGDEFWPNFGRILAKFWTKSGPQGGPFLDQKLSKIGPTTSKRSVPSQICRVWVGIVGPGHFLWGFLVACPSSLSLTFCRGILVIMFGPNMSVSTFSCLRGIFSWNFMCVICGAGWCFCASFSPFWFSGRSLGG